MTTFAKSAGIAGMVIAGLIAASSSPRAAEENTAVQEGQAVRTELGGDATAVSYWVSALDGWHVVTTIDAVSGRDTDAEHHVVARFSATLLPGQVHLISVPLPLGEQQQVLRIRRIGDQMEISRVTGSSI